MSLLLLGAACLCAAGCKRSQEAQTPTLVASELNLPGLSPEEKKLCEQHLAWTLKTTLGAYDRVGSKNAKWDTSARRALQLFAQVRAYGPDVAGFPQLLQYEAAQAMEHGCDDPLVSYLHTRFRSEGGSLPADQVNRDYGATADRMGASAYPPIRKFYAAQRASEAYAAHRKANAANANAAGRYRNQAVQYFFEFLEEKNLPLAEVDQACETFLNTIHRWGDEKELYDRMEAKLLETWPKAGFTYYVRGQFYVSYAWLGRSSKTADKVTDEQWKLFGERLATAAAILQEGVTNAPTEGRLPTLMIKVVSGQQKGLPEMERWFERAMEVNTNNLEACKSLIYFLLPRWYGSREDMLALGRHCLESDKWGGAVPLALVEAHYTYNRFDGAPDGSYWRQPDVWPDIKAAYDKFFARNPNARSYRSYYARFAYWCGQPEALREQLEWAGDNIDESLFGSREDYSRALAMAKAAAPPAGGGSEGKR